MEILAAKQGFARRWRVERPEEVHQRGLARPARSHDGNKFAVGHGHADATHRLHTAAALLIDLGDVDEFHHIANLSAGLRAVAEKRSTQPPPSNAAVGVGLCNPRAFHVAMPAAQRTTSSRVSVVVP